MVPSAKTANYTLTTADQLVTFNGSNLTATLPDPTTCAGTVLRVKNLNATGVTVSSAGTSKTIDGATSQLVLQQRTLQVVSDGAQWLTLSGNDLSATTTGPVNIYSPLSSTESVVWVQAGATGRPALRATVNSGTGAIFQGGQYLAGSFYNMFNITSGGSISKISNVDFTIAANTMNPQDAIPNGSYGITTDTASQLLYVRRNTNAAGTWNTHPVGFFSQPQTKTANYTVDFRDTLLIGNGTSITFTLPDPTSTGITGREFKIKNINATALTIVSAGTSKTIDGVASTTLSQWDKATVVSDGAQWLIVEGKKPVTVSTTAPTNPAQGDVWFDIS